MCHQLLSIARKARQYCQQRQPRTYTLEGACHENVLGAADYIRFNTDYTPLVVWGTVSNEPDAHTAESIYNVTEAHTHFWVELAKTEQKVIDVHTVNPITESGDIDTGIAYGGPQPNCYNTVERFSYFGQLAPSDLVSREAFSQAVMHKPVTPYQDSP